MADYPLPGPSEFSAEEEKQMRGAGRQDRFDLRKPDELAAAQDRLKSIGLNNLTLSGPGARTDRAASMRK